MRNLLALLLFAPSLCLAQIPGYVPQTGLDAWYSLDGTGIDESENGFHAQILGATSDIDRFGNSSGCYLLDGDGDYLTFGPLLGNVEDFTASYWLETTETTGYNLLLNKDCDGCEFSTGDWGFITSNGIPGMLSFFLYNSTGTIYENIGQIADGTWHHVVVTRNSTSGAIQFFVDGQGSEEYLGPSGSVSNGNDFHFGVQQLYNPAYYEGRVDDLGMWSRVLSEDEILGLFLSAPPMFGCTDSFACNYDSIANSDDGSCISCELIATYCGAGTVWSETLQQCVSIETVPDTIYVEPDACVPSCGEGTVWNPVLHECVVAIPADVDLSGCITAGDILALLAAFGTCPPAPDFPDTPEDALWTCGDLVEYWGYAYETVAIGTQCWFAENLKSSKFRDGEELILAQSDSSWEANAWTYAYCTVEGTSNNLEFLYKGGVVENPIEICPSGWHIPFDQDWMDLETELGMPDSALTLTGTRGSNELVGGRMKSNSTYWDSPNVLASDPSGFNAEPCGYRNHLGYMYDQNATTHFWNADPQGGNDSHARVLFHDLGGVYRYSWNGIGGTLGQRFGRSIRCVKD